MPSAKTFQLAAVLYGLAGMAWGLQMGISGDHGMMPAHAHLNLLEWVSLSIMAAFYRSAGRHTSPRLMTANFVLSALGPLVFVFALAMELSGHPSFAPVIGLGAVATMLGLATFGLAVMRAVD
ncbi:MAG TPA: hypothetical protein VGC92_04505 [Phenylobacterium sp.]|jgi:hypothetical protein